MWNANFARMSMNEIYKSSNLFEKILTSLIPIVVLINKKFSGILALKK